MLDYSTLNLERLKRLPLYKKPPTYHLSDSLGSGCAGDPPGYPTYFLRSVYTQYGNSPRSGQAQEVITLPTGDSYVIDNGKWNDWETHHKEHERLMRSLWKPLPYDHVRVRMWIWDAYAHSAHCYHITKEEAGPFAKEYSSSTFFVWPLPYYELKNIRIDERWQQRYKDAAQAEMEEYNRAKREHFQRFVTKERHLGYRRVVEFYPEHANDPVADQFIEASPTGLQGDWWATSSRRPYPDECVHDRHREGFWQHDPKHNWHQFCGWKWLTSVSYDTQVAYSPVVCPSCGKWTATKEYVRYTAEETGEMVDENEPEVETRRLTAWAVECRWCGYTDGEGYQ